MGSLEPETTAQPAAVPERCPREGSAVGSAVSWLSGGVAAGSPWLWFVVRDRWVILDAVAIGLPLVGAGALGALLLVALLARRFRAVLLATAASTLAAGTVAVLGPWVPQRGTAPTAPLRIAAANVLFINTEPVAATSAVIATDADVVVAVELTAATMPLMSAAFPFESSRPELFDEVVYSRWPISGARPLPGRLEGFGVRAVVDRPEGQLVVYGMHFFRPWFDDSRASIPLSVHRDLIGELHELVEGEQLPTVVAGDLNLVDRATGYRKLDASLRDAVRTEWAGPTTLKGKFRPLLARIDHIFVSEDWCARDGGRFEVPGSDHRGVLATIGPCPHPTDS